MFARHSLLKSALLLLGLALFTVALGAGAVRAEDAAPAATLEVQGAMGSGFTFHGQLAKNGAMYTGVCDFIFGLWDDPIGGAQVGASQTVLGVNVSGGVFSVVLNAAGQFGASAFDGDARWLEMQVKCSGDAAPAALGRQPLLAAPYALYAVQAGSVAPQAKDSIWPLIKPNVVEFAPAAEQLSVGDANGSAPMINLRGNSACCSTGAYTPAWFKVFQNGSFVATGNLGIGVSPMQGKGYRTSWDSFKGAFRSGYADNEWDNDNVGFFSWAGGSKSTAIGLYSLAFGDTNSAESTGSIVFGSNNQVKGAASFAAGAGNRVCDTYGVALGNNAKSGGPYINGRCDPDTFNIRGQAAVAIGYNVTADQDHTTALGKFASNNGFQGTFIWADGSAQQSADTFRNTANNEFAARAAGGFRFRTNLAGTTGCNLPAGSGVFNCTSDRNQKESFAALNGDEVLARLAGIPVETWNYKDDPTKTRHLGPTAQDFYAAFGLGGSDTTIGMLDIDGVNMLAIQALEKRTREVAALEARVVELEAEKSASQDQLADLDARLSALEGSNGAAPSPASAPWLWMLSGGLLAAVLGLGMMSRRRGPVATKEAL